MESKDNFEITVLDALIVAIVVSILHLRMITHTANTTNRTTSDSNGMVILLHGKMVDKLEL